MPAPFSAATQLISSLGGGDPNQVAANETEEERKRRLAQLANTRNRMTSALGGNGMAGGGLKVSPAVAALLGGGG
jgi:hypothetical protein